MQALITNIYKTTMKIARNSLHCASNSTHSGASHVNESIILPATDTMAAARAMFNMRFVKGRKEGGPVSWRERETPRRLTPESKREARVYSGLVNGGIVIEMTLRHARG